MKTCRRCRRELAFDSFTRDGTRPDGLHPYCRLCRQLANAERAARTANIPAQKRCSDCRKVQDAASFTRHAGSTDGLGSQCKSCRKARRATLETPERRHLWAKATHSRLRDQHLAAMRTYYAQNKSRLAEQRREQRTTPEARARAQRYMRDWYASNKDKSLEYKHKRRAASLANGGSFTDHEWRALLAKYGSRCLACGAQTRLSADHVVPLILGGSGTIENIQPLCIECNSRKGQRVIDYRS